MRIMKLNKIPRWIFFALVLVACEENEIEIDSTAPVISLSISEMNVIGGLEANLRDNALYLGDQVVATWKDNVSKECEAALSLDGKYISSGTVLSEAGKLTITVKDEAGNTANADITLTRIDSVAPQVSLLITEKNVIGGATISKEGNQICLNGEPVVQWTDDYTEECTVKIYFTSADGVTTEITPGTVLSDAGILEIVIIDDGGNSSSTSIALTSVAIYGLESLDQLRLQVDEEVDLLSGISFPEGVELSKVEILVDGVRTEISDPAHYSPEYPGTASLVFSLHLNNDSILEVESQILDIVPLDMPGYNIAQAAIGDGWEGVSTAYHSYTVKMNFEDTGVFKAWALLREIIAHGTRDASASEIKARLSRHQPVVFGEHPKAVDDIVWAGGSRGNWTEEIMTVHFEDECFFMCPDISDKIRNDWEIGATGHGLLCTKILYITIYPVIHALGVRIGLVGTQVLVEHDESILSSYYAYDGFKEELDWVKSHPETILYHTESIYFGHLETYIPQLVVQPNIGIFMCSFGNTWDTTNIGGRTAYFLTKHGEQLPEYTVDTHAWSYGADGAMGGWNNGETHVTVPPTIGWTMLPVESHKNDDDIWCESSQIKGWGGGQETSDASPAAMGKFYLASLLNYVLNPNLTVQENKRLIREACLDQYVYYGDDLYMIGKRVNPGGIVEKFFSTLPSSVSISGDDLVPLPSSVFPNSVIMGPGVVDSQGTPVTSDNYKDMAGKPLFISPVLLRKYGVKPGAELEYSEHFCLDKDGTGIDNPAEAGKSICNKVSVLTVS